jgi:hypothetical protein
MTQANEIAQQIYDLDEEVLVAKLGTLSEEMGGDLTGQSAPRGVSLDAIDLEFESRAPISQAAIEVGQKVFDRVNAEAYQICVLI